MSAHCNIIVIQTAFLWEINTINGNKKIPLQVVKETVLEVNVEKTRIYVYVVNIIQDDSQ
jgi:hypothetical protein